MAAADYDIANLALDHLKSRRKITALNETTEEAKAANRWYNLVRKDLLKAHDWNWAGAEKRAVLVEDTATANKHPEYIYSYTPPTDLLKPRKLLPGRTGNGLPVTRNVPAQWRIPFLWGNLPDGSARRIYTDFPPQASVSPLLIYTPDVTDATKFPNNFEIAFSFALAIRMVGALQMNPEIVKSLWPEWLDAWANATADEVTQQQRGEPPDASWILARY